MPHYEQTFGSIYMNTSKQFGFVVILAAFLIAFQGTSSVVSSEPAAAQTRSSSSQSVRPKTKLYDALNCWGKFASGDPDKLSRCAVVGIILTFLLVFVNDWILTRDFFDGSSLGEIVLGFVVLYWSIAGGVFGGILGVPVGFAVAILTGLTAGLISDRLRRAFSKKSAPEGDIKPDSSL